MLAVPVIAVAILAIAAIAGCSVSSPVSRELGARCESHDECAEMCLTGPSFPDGFCSQSCDTTSNCPGNAICVDIDQGLCLLPCSLPDDCQFLGPGWTCSAKDARQDTSQEVMVCIAE